MVRVVKNPDERRTEIMDMAQALFESQGYDQTSVQAIIEKTGIAKGTFYYYFKSKEEIMTSVVERTIEQQIQALLPIAVEPNLNALEKIRQILSQNNTMNDEHEQMMDYLHKPENTVMHQKSLVKAVQNFAPVFAGIIRQGVTEQLFQTEFPLELAEFYLVVMNFLFDPVIFPWKPEELETRMRTLAYVLETTLQAKKGSFDFIYSNFQFTTGGISQ